MFELVSSYNPAGDQPAAIAKLTEGLLSSAKHQTLLGVTGSGKTFTIANVIRNVNKPTLVISHNKTLAAQLYAEFKGFFPNNAVEYFVSYFDYYQPEAYIPRTDTFIEKDSSINEEIERLRLSTMSSLFSRRDVIVVASVSCIYGIGSKEDYEAHGHSVARRPGDDPRPIPQPAGGPAIHPQRHRVHARQFPRARRHGRGVSRRTRRMRLRIEFFGEQIERITRFEPLTGDKIETLRRGHDLSRQAVRHARWRRSSARILAIREELTERIAWFEKQGKLLEAQRIKMRTEYDLEMMQEMGFCSGHRELFAASERAPAGLAALHAVRFLSRRITCWSSTNRTPPCRRSAACTRATARAKRCWWSTGSACPARWTTGR